MVTYQLSRIRYQYSYKTSNTFYKLSENFAISYLTQKLKLANPVKISKLK